MRWQTTAALAVVLVALAAFYYVYEIRMGPERERAEARKGRVFSVEPADVQAVTITRAGDTVALEREGEGWRLRAPVAARGDRGKVEDVLTTVLTAKIDREIAAQPASLAEFGLDRPAAEIAVTLKDGRRLGLALGTKNPTGSWVYARETDRPAVFALPESVLRDATLPATDFRDRTILALDRQAVSGLEIATGEDTLVVEHAGDRWSLTRPRALGADAEAIGDLLDKLTAAKVKEFVAEAPPSLGPYGLDRPVRLTVHQGRDKDRSSRTLLFGRADAGRRGVYAMRAGETSVLLLPEDVWKALPKNVAAIRDKTVVAFERDRVTRLDLTSPRGEVTIERADGRWRITRPEPLPADQVEVGAVLMKLRSLKAQGFLSEDAAGVSRYLGRPEVRATLTLQGAQEPVTVLLAPSADRRGGQPVAYAAVAGRGPVVLVEGTALAEVGRSLADLRDRTLVSGLEPRDVKRVQVRSGGRSVLLERVSDTEWRVLEPARGAARRGKVDDLLWRLRALKWKEIAAPRADEPARWGLDRPSAEVRLYRADGTEIGALQVGRRDGERLYVRLGSTAPVYVVDAKGLEIPKVPDDFQG
jgi:hypothetical protein